MGCSPWGHKESDMTEYKPIYRSLWVGCVKGVETSVWTVAKGDGAVGKLNTPKANMGSLTMG